MSDFVDNLALPVTANDTYGKNDSPMNSALKRDPKKMDPPSPNGDTALAPNEENYTPDGPTDMVIKSPVLETLTHHIRGNYEICGVPVIEP